MLAEMLAPAGLEDPDLLAAAMGLDTRRHGLCQTRRPYPHAAVVGDQQHLIQGHVMTHLGGDPLDPHGLADRYPVLLATRLDYRVHKAPDPISVKRPLCGPVESADSSDFGPSGQIGLEGGRTGSRGHRTYA